MLGIRHTNFKFCKLLRPQNPIWQYFPSDRILRLKFQILCAAVITYLGTINLGRLANHIRPIICWGSSMNFVLLLTLSPLVPHICVSESGHLILIKIDNFHSRNTSKNIVCEMSAILSKGRWVKLCFRYQLKLSLRSAICLLRPSQTPKVRWLY